MITKPKGQATCSDSQPGSRGSKRRSDLAKSLKKDLAEEEEPTEWRVTVCLANDEDNDREEIDTSTLSKEDLRVLETDNPFLYYSIPANRRKSYLINKDNDVHTTRRSSLPPCFKMNTSMQLLHQDSLNQDSPENALRRKSIVRRNSRVSTEAHPTLIYDEMMLLVRQTLDVNNADGEIDCSLTADDLEILFAELEGSEE